VLRVAGVWEYVEEGIIAEGYKGEDRERECEFVDASAE
jgi:hypothetical protein